jgi:hypothetical protein
MPSATVAARKAITQINVPKKEKDSRINGQ